MTRRTDQRAELPVGYRYPENLRVLSVRNKALGVFAMVSMSSEQNHKEFPTVHS